MSLCSLYSITGEYCVCNARWFYGKRLGKEFVKKTKNRNKNKNMGKQKQKQKTENNEILCAVVNHIDMRYKRILRFGIFNLLIIDKK